MRVYLDNAATTLKKPFSVYKELMVKTVFSSVNPGRGTYRESIEAVSDIMDTQEELCDLFNISNPSRIAFFQNATYALNAAIAGFINPGEHIVISGMEHNSVARPVFRQGNFSVAKTDEKGNVSAESVKNTMNADTKLVIINHASNVSGNIQPIEEIIRVAHERGAKVLIDAAQSAGISEIDVERLGIDMLAFSGHKGLFGPLGTGGLYIAEDILLTPLVVGGTGSLSESLTQPQIMPDMLHSGTQNLPGICALGRGVAFVRRRRKEIFETEQYMARLFVKELLNIKGVTVYGNYFENRNGTVGFNIENHDSVVLAQRLDGEFGIKVRGGFHCAPLAHKSLKTSRKGCVRVSFGYFNKKSDVKKIIYAVNEIKKSGYN